MKKISLLVLTFFMVAYAVLANDQTVSVIPLKTSSGISKAELNTLTEYLESALIKTGKFDVIASEQRETILQELKFSLGGCSDQSCALEVGKLLSAKFMVFGTINKQGNSIILSVKRVNVQSSRIDENAIETLLTLSPAQIEATTLKLAYKLAGLTYQTQDELIDNYAGKLILDIKTIGAKAILNLEEEYTSFPVEVEDLPVGEYPLRISKEGYKTELLTVKIKKNKTTNIVITLNKENGPAVKPVAGEGFLNIYSSPPGMQVEIDHEILDINTPVENYPLREGEHFIVVGDFYNSYFKDKETWVMIEEGLTFELPVSLEKNHGTLLIYCNIEDSYVYVNGQKQGIIKNGKALIRNIPSGGIEVTISKDRYHKDTREMELRPGNTTEITAVLKPMPIRVVFDSNPQGAEVIFDGNSIGKTPTLIENISQTSHEYSLIYNEYTTGMRKLNISGIDDKTIIENLYSEIVIALSDGADKEAEIYIDDHYIGETESGRLIVEEISYGMHVLKIKKDGYSGYSENISVSEDGFNESFDLKLQDVKYSVITEPGQAEVIVDGNLLETLTPVTISLSEGEHELIIHKKGFLPLTESIVVDSTRGGRIKKSLVEGEDAEVLYSYYKGALGNIENPDAGILQCGEIIDAITVFEKEISGYNINVDHLKRYVEERKLYYSKRLDYLNTYAWKFRNHIDELDARKDAASQSLSGLWGWEGFSIVGAIGAGVGSYFAFDAAAVNNQSALGSATAEDTIFYESNAQLMEALAYVGIGTAVGGLISSILIPSVGMSSTQNDIDTIDSKLRRCGVELARLEITRELDLSIDTGTLDWKKTIRDVELGDDYGEVNITVDPGISCEIIIDRKPVGTVPGTFYLSGGMHDVQIMGEYEGKDLFSDVALFINSGDKLNRQFTLMPTPAQRVIDEFGDLLDEGESVLKTTSKDNILIYDDGRLEKFPNDKYVPVSAGINIFRISNELVPIWAEPGEILSFEYEPELELLSYSDEFPVLPGWVQLPPEPVLLPERMETYDAYWATAMLGGIVGFSIGAIPGVADSGQPDLLTAGITTVIGGGLFAYFLGFTDYTDDPINIKKNQAEMVIYRDEVEDVTAANTELLRKYNIECEAKNKDLPMLKISDIASGKLKVIYHNSGSVESWNDAIIEAMSYYNADNYQPAVRAFEEAIKSGCIDGVTWYRYAYSLEQINGLTSDVKKAYFAALELLKVQDPGNRYIASAETKVGI